MKIFVTGASGFVGRAALRKLVAAGHELSAMSRSERSSFRRSATCATERIAPRWDWVPESSPTANRLKNGANVWPRGNLWSLPGKASI